MIEFHEYRLNVVKIAVVRISAAVVKSELQGRTSTILGLRQLK